MKETFIEIFGWYGTAAIITAYALVSFSVLSGDSIWYQILNGTGAAGVLLLSLQKRAYQPAVLNVIWAAIALFAIFKILY